MTRTTNRAKFMEASGWRDSRAVRVAGDASNRTYDRLIRPDGTTAILMDAAPERGEDVRPFVRVAEYLCANGFSAPVILATDPDAGFLLIEDLGDALFADLMTSDPGLQTSLYQAAVEVLIELHQIPPLALPDCDAHWLTEMTQPVFDWYMPEGDELSAAFRQMFQPLAETVQNGRKVTILRDYHAQNLLWLPERDGMAKVGLLDFQDALSGHPAYDLVSILQDARRDVDPKTEADMIRFYLDRTGTDPAEFTRAYAVLGAQRNLRILGIFARLCLRDGKPSYIDLIPRVWKYVQRNLRHPDLIPLAEVLAPLPDPTPAFLEHLRRQCAASPS